MWLDFIYHAPSPIHIHGPRLVITVPVSVSSPKLQIGFNKMSHHIKIRRSPQMCHVVCVEKNQRNFSMFCYLNAQENVQMVRSLHVQCDILWWHYTMDALSPIVALCIITVTGICPAHRVTLIGGGEWGGGGGWGAMLAPWTSLSGQLYRTLLVSLLLAWVHFFTGDYFEKWGA